MRVTIQTVLRNAGDDLGIEDMVVQWCRASRETSGPGLVSARDSGAERRVRSSRTRAGGDFMDVVDLRLLRAYTLGREFSRRPSLTAATPTVTHRRP